MVKVGAPSSSQHSSAATAQKFHPSPAMEVGIPAQMRLMTKNARAKKKNKRIGDSFLKATDNGQHQHDDHDDDEDAKE